MDRSNHYEGAFEAYLRARQLGYVAVDEAHRSLLGVASVKSLDFVVVGADSRLVVDVKGRRFPSGTGAKSRATWQNWTDREDVEALVRWAERFGEGFVGVLAFVYHIQPAVVLPESTPDLFAWRGRRYLMRGVEAGLYRRHMKVRSVRWETVHLSAESFREIVRPFRDFVGTPSGSVRPKLFAGIKD